MLDRILAIPKHDESYAYKMGYDCVINGSNETNCHFSIFMKKGNTQAWERGQADARKDRNIIK